MGGDNDDIVTELLSHGADANLCDRGGKNPLHWAAIVGSIKCAAILHEQGKVSLDSLNAKGRTACHMASADGQVEFVGWLVDSGADVDILDAKGQTAFDLGESPRRCIIPSCTILLLTL